MATEAGSLQSQKANDQADSPIPEPPEFCLNDLVADETYEALKKTFLPKGKGRPPDPPTVFLTNRLLLQFEVLKNEGRRTYKDVAVWFERLFPSVSYPSSRLGGVLGSVLKKTKNLFAERADLKSFLQNHIDLDFVSPSLMKYELKRGHLLQEETDRAVTINTTQPSQPVTNEVIVDLENFRVRERLKDKFTTQWIRTLSGSTEADQVLVSNVKQMVTCYRSLVRKKGGVHDQKLAVFLATPFTVHTKADRHSCPKPAPPLLSGTEKLFSQTTKEKQRLQERVGNLETETGILHSTIQDLSADKKSLTARVEENGSFRKTVRHLQAVVKTQKQMIRELQPNNLQRMKSRIKDLRTEIQAYRTVRRELTIAKEKLSEEKTQAKRARESFLRQCRKQQQKLKKEKEENASLKNEIQALCEELIVASGHLTETRVKHESNRFTDEIRKTVLQLQAEANVPASKCAAVIRIVSGTLYGQHFADKELPCTQTSINISDEGQVLGKIQATEKILGSKNCTLHTDGTSRDHRKIVSQQITLDSGETLSFGFMNVATEDAATLLEVTVRQLEEMTDLYCKYKEEDMETTFQQILSRLTSFMSDRAAVMKKFNTEFLSFIRTRLGQETVVHFLYCNAHFLLGLSRACELSLKHAEEKLVQESQPQEKLGRDKSTRFVMFKSTEAATCRVIRIAADLTGPRGDEKNGCRMDWLAFCEEKDQKSRMTSYRSNRFNSFFEGAAAIIHHQTDLRSFFPSLGHSNLKIESLAADLDDQRLMICVCAVALIFIRITGPYWGLLQSHVKYNEFYKYVQCLSFYMDKWEEDAAELLDPNFRGVFKGEFELEGEIATLKESAYSFAIQHTDEVTSALQQLIPEMFRVLLRQLGDFHEGGDYGGPPATFPEGLDHCSLTNLLGENIFGDLDFDMGYRRHASTHHRSSTNMLSHNKTSKWLNKKNCEETSKLMKFARKEGKPLRQQHRQQEKLVMLRIREKLIQNEQKRLERDAKQAAAKADLIRRLAIHGGPCFTSNDIDALVSRLRREKESVLVNALKDQIRYQKSILNRKGDLRLSGSLEELTQILKDHLQDENSDEQAPEEAFLESEPFAFQHQGQWVAVFYDDQFYIGQVVHVMNKDMAMVNYLERTTGRSDYFKWPRVEDLAETSSCYVFRWDLDVNPVSSNLRMWHVAEISNIVSAYDALKEGC